MILVTAILIDLLLKDVNGWKLSRKKNKVVIEHFSGATTNAKELHIKPATSNNSEIILLWCSANELTCH